MEYLSHVPLSSKIHTDTDALHYDHLPEPTYACIWVADHIQIGTPYRCLIRELDIYRIKALWLLLGAQMQIYGEMLLYFGGLDDATNHFTL